MQPLISKKFLLRDSIILVIFGVCVFNSFAQESREVTTINTIAGELKIDSATRPNLDDDNWESKPRNSYVALNGKVIHNIDGSSTDDLLTDGNYLLFFKGHLVVFDIGVELVLISEFNGGNACNGAYRIIALEGKNKYRVFGEMGNCNRPVVTWQEDKVTFYFPPFQPPMFPNAKPVPAETWVYENYVLKQAVAKKTQTQKRKK